MHQGLPGCYGIALDGLDGARMFLPTADPTWPTVRVERCPPLPHDTDEFRIGDAAAELPLADGSRAMLDRARGTVSLHLRRDYTDEELLHPLLSGSLSIVNLWQGRDALHAGAFVLGERAWGVLGDRGQGKSSLLASLAMRGVSVLSDDVVVEQDGQVFAGPSFIDLRPDAARALECGRDMGLLGARERFRLDLPAAAAPQSPLGGWLTLAWGGDDAPVTLRPVPLEQRLALLYQNRSVLLQPASPAHFLRYAALPFFQLTRPKSWFALDEAERVLRADLG